MGDIFRFLSGVLFAIAALAVGTSLDLGAWQAWALGGVSALVFSGASWGIITKPRQAS